MVETTLSKVTKADNLISHAGLCLNNDLKKTRYFEDVTTLSEATIFICTEYVTSELDKGETRCRRLSVVE